MKRPILFLRYLALLISFLVLCFFSCEKKDDKEEMYQEVALAFDTVCSVQLFTKKNEQEVKPIFEEIFARLKELQITFSPTMSDSELYRLNVSDVGEHIKLSKELHYVIQENLKIARMTDGAFNPCIGSLTSLWRPLFNATEENIVLPQDDVLKEALKLTDYSCITLTSDSILKSQPCLIDLGASAKGYATDCVKEIIVKNGIERAIIDFGGNIATVGKKENGKAWRVGIKMPIVHNEGRVAGFLEVEDKAVVTSGNYERFFEKDGKLYHHIISSESGNPVDNELNAVTIVSHSATEADILSTTCFVLGLDEGATFMQKFPLSSAIFFLKNGEVVEVNNTETSFHIIDEELRYR